MKTHLLSYLARYLTIWLFLTSGMGALGQSKLLYPLEFGSEGIRLTTLSNLGLGSSSEVTFDTLNLGTDLNVQGSAIFTTATFSSNISVSGSASFHGDVSILDGISISDAGARRSLRDSLEVSGTLYVSNLTSGSSSLKSVTTTDKAVDRIYLVKTAGVFYVFALEASTHEEEGINWIRPNDYNASTNAKVWRRLALFTPFLNVTDDLTIGGNVTISNAGAREDLREAIGAASIAELEQRERSGYLVSDGSTANRAAGIWKFGQDGAVGGYAITIPFEFVCSTTNPEQSWNIASFGPVHGDVAGIANSLYIRINGPISGNLAIGCTGATGSDIRNFTYAGFVAAYAGQYVRGVAVFEPGSTTPSVVVVNGKSIKDEMSLATSGTPATYLNSNLETTFFLSGSLSPGGVRIWPHAPILGAVTTDEAIEWTLGGDWPDWVYQAGSAVARYTSNFAAGTDSWVKNTAGDLTLTGNEDVVGGEDDTLKVTTTTGSPMQISRPSTVIPGAMYEATFRYYATEGCGVAYLGFGTSGIKETVGDHVTVVEGSPQTARLRFISRSTSLRLAGFTTATGSVTDSLESGKSIFFKDIVVTQLGPLALPRVQSILALDDRLSRYGARVLGFTPVTFGDSRWRVIGNTATSGNERILEGPVFGDYESVVIDDVVMTCSNNNTVTLGSSSGGAQYKTSGALVPGTNVISLVTRLPASNSFWVGSDSNYPIRTWITGHMAGMHVDMP